MVRIDDDTIQLKAGTASLKLARPADPTARPSWRPATPRSCSTRAATSRSRRPASCRSRQGHRDRGRRVDEDRRPDDRPELIRASHAAKKRTTRSRRPTPTSSWCRPGRRMVPTPLPHPFTGRSPAAWPRRSRSAASRRHRRLDGRQHAGAHRRPRPARASSRRPSEQGHDQDGQRDREASPGKPAARNGDTAMTCNDPADAPSARSSPPASVGGSTAERRGRSLGSDLALTAPRGGRSGRRSSKRRLLGRLDLASYPGGRAAPAGQAADLSRADGRRTSRRH